MIWPYRLALNTNRAAAFTNDCNRRSWYNGRPANIAFPKSSFYNTRATTINWKTEQVSERRILRRNVSNESEFRISGGRLFQACAAAKGNARSPSVVRLVDGNCSVRMSAQRRRQRAATLVDRRSVSARYCGAVLPMMT